MVKTFALFVFFPCCDASYDFKMTGSHKRHPLSNVPQRRSMFDSLKALRKWNALLWELVAEWRWPVFREGRCVQYIEDYDKTRCEKWRLESTYKRSMQHVQMWRNTDFDPRDEWPCCRSYWYHVRIPCTSHTRVRGETCRNTAPSALFTRQFSEAADRNGGSKSFVVSFFL